MTHPYTSLPDRAFWRSAVAKADRDSFPSLYQPRFGIDRTTRVATAGSCFAQHIGTYLALAGCTILQAEPAPKKMPAGKAKQYGYGLFSARYGNVYTARQLRQLLADAAALQLDPVNVWEKDGRFYDALRPNIEPNGLDSVEEVLAHRYSHLTRTAAMLRKMDVFVFTLGLTETWIDAETGRVFPTCPGVIAGQFDPARHKFHNFTMAEVLADLHAVQALLQQFRPGIEMLLTVSPVPLTATAADDHVLAATTYSKSVLRAAAGEFVMTTDDVDYFPSYEIITAPASGGPWFAENMRSVRPEGVEKVMGIFLNAHGLLDTPPPPVDAPTDDAPQDGEDDDLICEELLLQAFSK